MLAFSSIKIRIQLERLTFSVDAVRMLVGFGSLHRQFPHNSGQNFAILIQYGIPDVGSFFKLQISLILGTDKM